MQKIQTKHKLEIATVEVEINDHLINKFMETIVMDFPVSKASQNNQSGINEAEIKTGVHEEKRVDVSWEGLDMKIKVRRDVTLAKLIQCNLSLLESSHSVSREQTFDLHIGDIRVS